MPHKIFNTMMILGFAGVGFMAYRRKRSGSALIGRLIFRTDSNSKPP